MDSSVTIFAKRLKKYLKSGHITVLTLSKITGISHQAIYKYASGDVEAGLGNAEKIANALGYSLSDFISDGPSAPHTAEDCLNAISKIVKKST